MNLPKLLPSITFICISTLSLTGCSSITTSHNSSSITNKTRNMATTQANQSQHTAFPANPSPHSSLNNCVIPKHGDLATTIPKNAEYLEVEMMDVGKEKVGVMIGHQLTTQGTGIQDHGDVFEKQRNHVGVYIPRCVVFETVNNSDLFAYFPPQTSPIPKNPKSVWLLMYGGTMDNYVMTGGTLNTKDLAQWGTLGKSPEPQVQAYVKEAEQNGWHIYQTVNIQHNLTGYLGHNGWARIPIGVPVNLVNAVGGGNEVFEIRGVISQSQFLKAHPELKAGIEAAMYHRSGEQVDGSEWVVPNK